MQSSRPLGTAGLIVLPGPLQADGRPAPDAQGVSAARPYPIVPPRVACQ